MLPEIRKDKFVINFVMEEVICVGNINLNCDIEASLSQA